MDPNQMQDNNENQQNTRQQELDRKEAELKQRENQIKIQENDMERRKIALYTSIEFLMTNSVNFVRQHEYTANEIYAILTKDHVPPGFPKNPLTEKIHYRPYADHAASLVQGTSPITSVPTVRNPTNNGQPGPSEIPFRTPLIIPNTLLQPRMTPLDSQVQTTQIAPTPFFQPNERMTRSYFVEPKRGRRCWSDEENGVIFNVIREKRGVSQTVAVQDSRKILLKIKDRLPEEVPSRDQIRRHVRYLISKGVLIDYGSKIYIGNLSLLDAPPARNVRSSSQMPMAPQSGPFSTPFGVIDNRRSSNPGMGSQIVNPLTMNQSLMNTPIMNTPLMNTPLTNTPITNTPIMNPTVTNAQVMNPTGMNLHNKINTDATGQNFSHNLNQNSHLLPSINQLEITPTAHRRREMTSNGFQTFSAPTNHQTGDIPAAPNNGFNNGGQQPNNDRKEGQN